MTAGGAVHRPPARAFALLPPTRLECRLRVENYAKEELHFAFFRPDYANNPPVVWYVISCPVNRMFGSVERLHLTSLRVESDSDKVPGALVFFSYRVHNSLLSYEFLDFLDRDSFVDGFLYLCHEALVLLWFLARPVIQFHRLPVRFR